jgi:hypothetical protein
MPFVDRVHEIDVLKRVLYALYGWWEKVTLTSPGTWEMSYKDSNFSFIICGAASGIGKSTFARMEFVEMLVCSQLIFLLYAYSLHSVCLTN